MTASGPNLGGQVFVSRMLVLPSGQVLFSNGWDNNLYVYNPAGSPSSSWVAHDQRDHRRRQYVYSDGYPTQWPRRGRRLRRRRPDGLRYPIVRLTASNGTVSFAKTFNWSSEWVATGKTPESTEFTLPAGDGPGVYSLSVIANGIASTPAVVVIGSSGNDTVAVDTLTAFFGLIPTVTATLNGATSSYFQFGVSRILRLHRGWE